MRIAKYIIFFCLICLLQPYSQAAQTELEIKLHGKGTVTEKQGAEQIHVEGTVKGDIVGTFIWEEEHKPGFEMGSAVEKGTITINDKNGDILILDFTGKTKKIDLDKSDLEGAQGGFSCREGTGHWADNHIEGTYSKAGHFQDHSIELTASLKARVK